MYILLVDRPQKWRGCARSFTDDGYYGFENQGATGREEIKAFYDMRKARGHRVSRHIFSPVCIHEETADRITGTTMLTLIAADGKGRILPTYTSSQIIEMNM